MNINELNRINVLNIDEKLAGVESGTGTFKEILNNVMSGVIIPIVENSGRIVGINFDTKVTNLIDDCVEQRKFEIRYSCKPVMDWVLKALKLKADGKKVVEVIENEEEGIKVVLDIGEIVEIEAPHKPFESERTSTSKEELPEEVDVEFDELDEYEDDDNLVKAIKKYLRDTYGHYLSGFYGDPEVEKDEDEEVYHVTNIHWGRKI